MPGTGTTCLRGKGPRSIRDEGNENRYIDDRLKELRKSTSELCASTGVGKDGLRRLFDLETEAGELRNIEIVSNHDRFSEDRHGNKKRKIRKLQQTLYQKEQKLGER